MAGRVEGKVAFITGGARGQGRSHAKRLAEEGADIVIVDLARPDYDWMTYPNGSPEQLAETARIVEDLDRRCIARVADVRDRASLSVVVDEAIAEFGHIDIVCANAGISPFGPESWNITEQQWDDVLNVNLKGVWNTTSAIIPHMIEAGRGGSIIITSSGAGVKGAANLADYCSSKFGVIGYMKSVALEVAKYFIRVNCLAPGNTNTDMIQNPGLWKLFRPDLENPTSEDAGAVFRDVLNLMPVKWLEPIDQSNGVLYLASDEGRYVTGQVLGIDLGSSIR
jgi:(+)-trans-carveol dehydrogenase